MNYLLQNNIALKKDLSGILKMKNEKYMDQSIIYYLILSISIHISNCYLDIFLTLDIWHYFKYCFDIMRKTHLYMFQPKSTLFLTQGEANKKNVPLYNLYIYIG